MQLDASAFDGGEAQLLGPLGGGHEADADADGSRQVNHKPMRGTSDAEAATVDAGDAGMLSADAASTAEQDAAAPPPPLVFHCPLGDGDADADGYPDACDTVLWDIDSPAYDASSFAPFTTAFARFRIQRSDNLYLFVDVPIDGTATTRSVTDGASVSAQVTSAIMMGTFDDIRDALTNKKWSTVAATEARNAFRFSDQLHPGGATALMQTPNHTNPIASTATITRLVTDSYATADGTTVKIHWQVRGY